MAKIFGMLIAVCVVAQLMATAHAQTRREEPAEQQETGPRSTARLNLSGPVPRTADGEPDLRGNWNAPPLFNSHILEEHVAGFGIQAGKSVVVDPPDGLIPYQPWALAQRSENRRAENAYLDNEGRCILSGLPRIMLFSFQATYAGNDIVLLFDYIHATRIIHMDGRPHLPEAVKLWMGDSIGRWEGDTLIVDTTNFNGKFWFALGGDFMTDAGHIVERFTMSDPNTLQWQATITDPKAYTRPWTMKWNRPYLRGTEEEVLDDDCHEGNADLAHLKKIYDDARAAAANAGRPERAASGGVTSRASALASAAQGTFSGVWHFNQSRSPRGRAGGTSFPSQLVIGQTATEVHLDSLSERQDPVALVYKLDGSALTVPGPGGMSTTTRATLEGDKLVAISERRFSTPAGDVVVATKDVYTRLGNELTVERTQTVDGVEVTAKASFDAASASGSQRQ